MIKVTSSNLLSEPEGLSYIATYSSKDFTLEVDLKEFVKPKTGLLLIIYDTLVFTVDAGAKMIVSIDSYTNKDLWQQCKIDLPSYIMFNGRISVEKSEIQDDRVSVEATPKYIYDADKKFLLVQLIDSRPEVFWKMGDKLIVGVSNNRITSVYIQDLSEVQ